MIKVGKHTRRRQQQTAAKQTQPVLTFSRRRLITCARPVSSTIFLCIHFSFLVVHLVYVLQLVHSPLPSPPPSAAAASSLQRASSQRIAKVASTRPYVAATADREKRARVVVESLWCQAHFQVKEVSVVLSCLDFFPTRIALKGLTELRRRRALSVIASVCAGRRFCPILFSMHSL